MTEDRKEQKTVTVDDLEYAFETLSNQAKNMVIFIQKLDREMESLHFEVNKVNLARAQILENLREELKETQAKPLANNT